MNNTPGSTIEELQQQVRTLQTFFIATLAVLVLLSGSLNLFVLRQVSLVSKQSEETQKFVTEYHSNSVPVITEFVKKLTAAAKTNTEVARLLTKYNIQDPVANPGASSLSPTPAPATAPVTAPKK
jgi:hypothetical protein